MIGVAAGDKRIDKGFSMYFQTLNNLSSCAATISLRSLSLISLGLGLLLSSNASANSFTPLYTQNKLPTEVTNVKVVRTNSDQTARNIMSGNAPTFNNDSLKWGANNQSNAYGNTDGYGGYGSYYDDLHTGSRGVLVVDLKDNSSIYEKNADVARPIASITKLMAAMVVLDAKQDMAEEIYLERTDFRGPKKASSRLRVGDKLNRAELLLIMLMKSENPAAKSLARHYPGGYAAFMNAMNQKAQDLGMYTSWFGDPSGLDKRNVASPRDLVKMVKAAGEYNVVRSFSTTKSYDFYLDNRVYAARNTSYLVRDGMHDIGVSKTGYIREAGRCYVMETMVNGRPAVVVILGARSSRTRWEDAENILGFLSRRFKHT